MSTRCEARRITELRAVLIGILKNYLFITTVHIRKYLAYHRKICIFEK